MSYKNERGPGQSWMFGPIHAKVIGQYEPKIGKVDEYREWGLM